MYHKVIKMQVWICREKAIGYKLSSPNIGKVAELYEVGGVWSWPLAFGHNEALQETIGS